MLIQTPLPFKIFKTQHFVSESERLVVTEADVARRIVTEINGLPAAQEYARIDRWHISLSEWFRDHVYSRFVFAAIKGKWFKNKYVASYLGFIFSMGLMGLWHGTAWHYILYGFYHGILLILTDWLERMNKKKKWWKKDDARWKFTSTVIDQNL